MSDMISPEKQEQLKRIMSQLATLRRPIGRCDPVTQQQIIARFRNKCRNLEIAAMKIDKSLLPQSAGTPVKPKTRQELLLEQIRREHGPNVQIEFVCEEQPRSVWTVAQAGIPGSGKRR
ncbi:hypothetical protein R69746_07684 [Paraburkholderia aspalathi]|uniref:hypothetical protein n=1 Tax=Paraburkholderia aspalathi TaxID=1324617 RepID=UPI00190B51BC|nr:hypothetical protein [Paraburkholderia aspalathi]MBK3843673.1 hypothetical protein [Paraburkholderia aspalathi]CAE6858227.1 hypothetical protein R69746_07684 [Paraburkholderia aspalathi]